MLTQDHILELLADTLWTDGPEEVRDMSKEEILSQMREALSDSGDPEDREMMAFVVKFINRIYELGASSVQT